MPPDVHSHRWRLFTADLSGVATRALDDAAHLETLLSRCFEVTVGSRPALWLRHCFEPQGVSLLAQGPHVRLAVHTWPELGAATLDVWSDHADVSDAIRLCAAALGARVAPRPDVSAYSSASPGE